MNKKIIDLDEINVADGTDYLVIYNRNAVSLEKTKKIELYHAIGYEEGIWYPVFADAEVGGNTGTMTVEEAHYIKMGKKVTVQAKLLELNNTGMTGANNLYIRGLPYTNSYAAHGSVMLYNFTFTGIPIVYASGGGNYVRILKSQSGGAWTFQLVNGLTSGSAYMYFTLTYFTGIVG